MPGISQYIDHQTLGHSQVTFFFLESVFFQIITGTRLWREQESHTVKLDTIRLTRHMGNKVLAGLPQPQK